MRASWTNNSMTEIVTRVALAAGALLGQGGVSTYLAECGAQILLYALSLLPC